MFDSPHYGCPSTFFRPAHAGESWECPCLVAGARTADGPLQCVFRSQQLRSLIRKCGMDAGIGLCIVTSDPQHVRHLVCIGAGQTEIRAPGNWGRGILSPTGGGPPRVHPLSTNERAGPLLAARCAGDKKSMDCQTTYRSNGKEKEQAAFKRSSIMQRSPTLTTGTPTRGLKTSPPPVSGKRKEEVDLAMEVTNLETPQAKKEGIPPSKSPLRAAFGLQMLRQQLVDASEEEDLSLNKMKALLKEMARALLTQRNVNKAIKDGIPKLDDFLGEIEECRKIRLKAVKQEREIMNRVISDSPQAQAHLAESQTQARKRAKRQRGVPAPAAALIPASIQSTPLNSQGPASQTHLGNWERRLSKKERRQLKRAEAASKKTPAKRKKKAQVSEPVKETPSKISRKPSRPRLKKPRAEAIMVKPLGGRSLADILGQI
ncbi:hypothetical protein J6590_074016 [Homalodisca vitripennis]|nr:hypothetical protein J6590_074016 [Homalodisca vitripennis]